MNFVKISSRVKDVYLSDPYATLQHYRRALGLLRSLRHSYQPIVQLGIKNSTSFMLESLGNKISVIDTKVSRQFISSISSNYCLILCFDPVFYRNELKGAALPVLSAATSKEIVEYPEILSVSDYILPVPSGRVEVALKHLEDIKANRI